VAVLSKEGANAIYQVAQRWVDEALRSDGSLFTPGRPVWTEENIGDLYQRFVSKPDTSADSFSQKLKRQLGDASDAVIQLAAEVLYVHLLIIDEDQMGGKAKRAVVQEVLTQMDSPAELGEDLSATLDTGISGGGIYMLTGRPFHMRFLIEMARSWNGLDDEEQRRLLEDAWRFRSFVMTLDPHRGQMQRNALLHLVFPTHFEQTLTDNQKQEIAERFQGLVSDTAADLDRRLFQIRETLSLEHGEFDFYETDAVAALWRSRLGAPFDRIFDNFDQADDALQFFGHALQRLGVTGPDDDRFSILVRSSLQGIHLSFGNWLVAGAYATPEEGRLGLSLLDELGQELGGEKSGEFAQRPDEPPVSYYRLPFKHLSREDPAFLEAYERSMERIGQRFSHWKRTPYRGTHQYELGEALFDESKRRELLTGGLKPSRDPWDDFVKWLQRLTETVNLDEEERNYKLEIASKLARAREATEADEEQWVTLLKRAFGAPNNITTFYEHGQLVDWCTENRQQAREALLALWDADEPVPAGIRGFVTRVPESLSRARRTPTPAFLLMAVDPQKYPPYRVEPYKKGYRLAAYGVRDPEFDAAAEYEHALSFLDDLLAEASARGLDFRDRLDAQGALWALTKMDPPAEWPKEEQEAFLRYRDGEGAVVQSGSVYEFVDDEGFRFPAWLLTDYLLSLATKPFVILSGISGTGKTKMAQLVARFLTPDETRVVEVQGPPADESDSFLHKIGLSTTRHAVITVPMRKLELFRLPPSGESEPLVVELGADYFEGRLGNIRLSDPRSVTVQIGYSRSLARVLEKKEGDYLRVVPLSDRDGKQAIRLELIPGQYEEQRVESRSMAFISVRADWTDNRGMLGYYNPLTEQYVPTELLKLLLRAKTNPEQPHLAILDEMNLAKVEYYFSDFLSAMESVTEMVLHDAGADVSIEMDGASVPVPERLTIPSNVFFTGTVNVDETTFSFSPKVLDRANVIEFNEVNLARYGVDGTSALDGLVFRKGVEPKELLKYESASRSDWQQLDEEFRQHLVELHAILEEHHLHFGYRVANEIARYMGLARENLTEGQLDAAFDLQVLQKILPKLAGNRARLEPVLWELLGYLHWGEPHTLDRSQEVLDELAAGEAAYPRSARKVRRMLETVRRVGFVSFVE